MEFFIKALTSLIIIMGPFALIPVFVSITENNTKKEKDKIARKAILVSFIICLFFVVLGNYFFTFFGFSIPSFRVAGGILLLLMSISMLHATRSKIRITDEEQEEGVHKDDVSIFPLAIPMITGPGTISTIILLLGEIKELIHWVLLVLAILISHIVMWLTLKLSEKANLILRATGINILNRIMGLILAAMSIEFIFTGIKSYFKF